MKTMRYLQENMPLEAVLELYYDLGIAFEINNGKLTSIFLDD